VALCPFCSVLGAVDGVEGEAAQVVHRIAPSAHIKMASESCEHSRRTEKNLEVQGQSFGMVLKACGD